MIQRGLATFKQMCIRDSTYAAGLSMKVENVEEFTRRFETYVTEHILPEQTSAVTVSYTHLIKLS